VESKQKRGTSNEIRRGAIDLKQPPPTVKSQRVEFYGFRDF
jgi:hypothetical protein